MSFIKNRNILDKLTSSDCAGNALLYTRYICAQWLPSILYCLGPFLLSAPLSCLYLFSWWSEEGKRVPKLYQENRQGQDEERGKKPRTKMIITMTAVAHIRRLGSHTILKVGFKISLALMNPQWKRSAVAIHWPHTFDRSPIVLFDES